jgi:hypothetical protein
MNGVMMAEKAPISYQDSLAVIKRLLEVAEERNEPFEEPIVMVGGTAMMAHDIRKQSRDVDLYAGDFSDDVVHQVEEEFKKRLGDDFKIDVTSAENIWGSIMLRDIRDSEPTVRMKFRDHILVIRRLSVEDLFLLKLDTEREKDRDDLPVLYERTSLDRLIDRFNIIWKWHGDRNAVLGYADRFVSIIRELGNPEPLDVIDRLKLPGFMAEMLRETHGANSDEAPRP